ncbi:MAG: iron-containing alcohol dehydrogenase [Oscillospiraceae bacterium]|nr:iron-containing alcohol dehydrogenase [Oscillospiraceae bacterium]
MIIEDRTTLRSLKHMLDYAVSDHASDPAVTYKTPDGLVSRTYLELQQETEALSRFFVENGLKGAHAALISINSYQWIVSYFGTVNCGSVMVPLAANETPERLIELIAYADCKVVFLDTLHKGMIPAIKNAAPQVEYIIITDGEAAEGSLALSDIVKEYAGSYTEEPDGDSLCAIVFTSGTTGFPKGVMLTHRNFVLSATCVHTSIPTRTEMCVLPLSHCFAFTASLTKSVVDGKQIFINDGLPNVLDNLRLFRPESISVVPQLAKKLMFGALKFASMRNDLTEQQAVKAFFGGKLVNIVSGGAPMEAEHVIRFAGTGVPVLNGYGMTECAPAISNNAIDGNRPGSVGKPISCMDTIIRDGQVLVKGPSVFKGYYKNPEATAEAFTEDGYFKTGDLGYFDNDGFLFLTGRCKNLILLDNGENVSAEQLEERFAGEVAVKEVVCYGEGNAIIAEVFLDTEFLKENNITDPDAYMINVLQHVNSGLASFQRISRYVIRPVPFKRNASMKIIRTDEHMKSERKITAPVTPTEKLVCSAAAQQLMLKEVGIDDNFFALGGDSLSAVEFALALNIEPQLIYDKPFLGLLAQAIDEMKCSADVENEEEVNSLINETKGGTRSDKAQNILLTGATGFLGAHVLYRLLKEDVTVYVLVRSKERFYNRMKYYFGDISLDNIKVIIGDIEVKHFGLTSELYRELAEKIDTVIHTAANVHHAGDYSDLARTNVDGTNRVIRFAMKADAVLQHTSTVSLHGAGTVIEDRRDADFDEFTLYIGQHYTDNVYIHSKYEAERAVLNARKEGLKANIFRMGNLTWRSSDGVFQKNSEDNGFLHRIRATLKLGIINDNMDKYPMDLTAIDESADAVVLLSLTEDINNIYHIINPNYLPMADMFRLLDVPCRQVSSLETIETVAANSKDRDVMVLKFYSLISARSENVNVKTDFTVNALKACGFEWGQPDERYLKLGDHCLGYEPYEKHPMRSTGGTMSHIQNLFLSVLRGADIPESETVNEWGCIERLPEFAEKLSTKKPFVITFEPALSNPKIKSALDKLPSYTVFTDIKGEPTLTEADAALDMYNSEGCDGVIAIGGGSVLDVSKITALRAGNPDADIDSICKIDSKANRCVPFIAVPTTAGTGSEATIYAVIGDEEGNKKPFISTKFIPQMILLDGELTVSVPAATTAYTGIDALSHIIEASVSLYAPAFYDDLANAAQAAADIMASLETAVKEPDNADARSALLSASHEAGIAFRRTSTGYIHAIAHRLGEIYHIPHGLAIASVLTPVLSASRPYTDNALSALAKACGLEEKPEAFLDAADDLISAVGIDVTSVKVKPEDIDEIVRKAQDEVRVTGYPKPFGDDELKTFIKEYLT